jgi:hypothetical protein
MTSLICFFATLFPLLPLAAGSQPRRAPTSDTAARRTFAVRGLADWDRLKIRLQPTPSSPAVGEIPPKASGVIATGRSRRAHRALWREVEYQGVRGWVHGRFVTPRAGVAARVRAGRTAAVSGVDQGPVFAQDLVCVGAAPAWKLIVDRDGSAAGNASFGAGGLGDVHALPAQLQKEKGRPAVWSMTLADAQGIGALTLSLRRTERCQVLGTNDRYVYEAATYQPSGRVLTGCCNALPRAPVIVVEGASGPPASRKSRGK